jgi:hypothetical protein
VADGTTLNYAPSPLTPPADATTYAPSKLPSAPGNYGPQIPPGVTITPAQISRGIISNESGGRTNVVSPQGAVGYGQIMPGTFKQYARPGENINNPADNIAVHNRIIADYNARWPNDPARVAVAYFSGPGNVSKPGSPTPWIKNTSDVNENVSKYVANALAKMGGPAGGTAVAASAPPAAALSSPANVGLALAALNAPTGGTKSTMDNLQSTFGGGGGGGDSNVAPMNLEAQQAAAAMGNARQAQIAAMAPQLMTASRQMGGLQGIRNAPSLGSTMSYQGGQMMPMATTPATPGTTLNSTGGLYG